MRRHQHALERYERDAAGIPCVDVATERAGDLYSYFDRFSPYLRRDLEQDLVDYLLACAEEIHPQPFVVRFSFAQAADGETQQRIRHSMNSFFTYLLEKERLTLRRMVYRSVVFLLLGLLILLAAVLLRGWTAPHPVVLDVIAEGVNIAGWISMWEALATFAVDWFPHRRNLRLYRNLASAQLRFQLQDTHPGPQHS
jgi:hypothetical protein